MKLLCGGPKGRLSCGYLSLIKRKTVAALFILISNSGGDV